MNIVKIRIFNLYLLFTFHMSSCSVTVSNLFLYFTSDARPNPLLLWPAVSEGDGICVCIIDSMMME